MTTASPRRALLLGACFAFGNLAAAASVALCALWLAGGTPGSATCEEAGGDVFSCANGATYGFTALLALSVPLLLVLAWRRYSSPSAHVWALAVGANALLQALLVTVLTPHA